MGKIKAWNMPRSQTVRAVLVSFLLFLFVGHSLNLWSLQAVTWVERGIHDWQVDKQQPASVHPQVVILDIDERSLLEVGRWPWPRDRLAEVLDRLFGPDCQRMKAVGLDMILAEPDLKSGADAKLAEVMGRCPVVIGWYLSSQSDAITNGSVPMPVLMEEDLQGFQAVTRNWRGHTTNLPEFEAAASSGLINALLDSDGQQRRVPLVLSYEGQMHESLALSLWRSTLPPHSVHLGPRPKPGATANPEFLELVFPEASQQASYRIPLDLESSMGIQWRGQGYRVGGGFDYISLADVLQGKVDEQRLKGKIGLLGSSSPGLQDLRATPVNAAFPGVEIHALALASFLDQNFLTTPAFAMGWEIASLIALAVLGTWVLQRLSPGYALVMTLGLALSFIGSAQWMRSTHGWIMPVASPLMLLTAIFLLYIVWGYWSENRKKREFVALFGQYVPPQLVEKMSLNPAQYSMAPKQAELTILFSDVRGFTSISEQLSPDDLRDYINQYLSQMSECISEQEGTLDKFIGDAVMAFWGAPVEKPGHALAAVNAALDMLQASAKLSQKFQARGWPALSIGIGLNSGEVRVGDMGSDKRRAYTVMGDPVNLASRLESLTKRYGAGLLVGESTMAQAHGHRWLLLDKVRVKGKEAPVCIYTPIRLVAGADHALESFVANWQIFFERYTHGEWLQARNELERLRKTSPHLENLHLPTLITLYMSRLDELQTRAVPSDWQGITTFEDK